MRDEIFEKFNPVWSLETMAGNTTPRWLDVKDGWHTQSIEELRAANAHWFQQPIAFQLTVPVLWLINQEFTRRGVAPGWRGVSRFQRRGRMPPPATSGPRRLGDAAKTNLMMRWIDLEWLRRELGPGHVTRYRAWQNVFAKGDPEAFTAFAKVCAIVSHGGGKYGPQHAFAVLRDLDVPKRTRIGLAGLIDTDAGSRRSTAEKRLMTTYRPALEQLMERPRHALTPAEVERRLVHCEAIELARGQPTDAAIYFGWMTGEAISRQTMHEMRVKLRDQCGFTTMAWRDRR